MLLIPVKRGDSMSEKVKVTVTAKVKKIPSPEQADRLIQTLRAYQQACNQVSQLVFELKKLEYDLVWRRDYSLLRGQLLSINTLEGRIKVSYETKGMEAYFDGSWSWGTAKLVAKRGKFFLHIS